MFSVTESFREVGGGVFAGVREVRMDKGERGGVWVLAVSS